MTVAEMAKKYYDEGLWPIDRLKALVVKKKLTKAEYKEITGEAYKA